MQAGGSPGTIYSLGDALCEADSSSGTSLHEIGLVEAIRMVRECRRPGIVTVIGIEPEVIAAGMELSAAVSRSLSEAERQTCDTVRSVLNSLDPERESQS